MKGKQAGSSGTEAGRLPSAAAPAASGQRSTLGLWRARTTCCSRSPSLHVAPRIKRAMVRDSRPRLQHPRARACGTGYGHGPEQSPDNVSAACGGEVTTPATLNPREPFWRRVSRPGPTVSRKRTPPIRTQLSSHPHLHGLRDAPQARLTMVEGCYPTHRELSAGIVHSRNGPRPSAV